MDFLRFFQWVVGSLVVTNGRLQGDHTPTTKARLAQPDQRQLPWALCSLLALDRRRAWALAGGADQSCEAALPEFPKFGQLVVMVCCLRRVSSYWYQCKAVATW